MNLFKKIISVFVLLCMLASMLVGCGEQAGRFDGDNSHKDIVNDDVNAPGEEDKDGEESVPPFDKPDVSPDPNVSEQPNVTDQPIPPASAPPIDICTIGGVVVVGEIGMDQDGWYIIPEQPLNVSFEYFLDNPSYFEGVTRIDMFDPKDDGVDKMLYLGQTVTISGRFTFYRSSFDQLYLLPYSIAMGKTTEQCYAAPDLQPPDLTQSRYDPTVPLPKYMDSKVENGQYVYNAFMLSTETLELMGNDFVYFYLDFVDAFLNYRDECPCPDEYYAEMLSTVIYCEFPLYNACAEPFEFFKHYDRENSTVSIKYLFDREEHQDVIEQFMAAANELLATTAPDQTERELAQNIYHEICTRMTYDDSALIEISRKESHYAYLYQSGVCVTFANVYCQLLTQVGIDSTLARCDYTPTMGHMWSIVTIDGENYFCDPTFELSFKEGSAYCYFGMNYAMRTEGGLGSNGMYGGRYYTYPLEADMFSEKPIQF